MKIRLKIATLFVLASQVVIGQNGYLTSNEAHILWQPNTKITKTDYQGQPTSQVDKMMDEYGFTASASVGLWSVLDIPKKKKDRYKKFEKVYFAPAFEKTTSYIRTNDSLQIEMQNLYFDICEVWARWARKELKVFQDATKATGTMSIFYMTVKEDMHKNRISMFRAYFKEVFIDKNKGAFEKWRKEIDKTLEETKMWATAPEECHRLLTQKPIEEGYIMAPPLIGPLFNDKK
ncbi:hypothetical protein [Flavobacterium sp.]|uniref:hypothetical protein n=1 Tax=Flavobacterium sp. TaxID=239 RepID=UPI00286E9BEF|nr:hypothetical protein [Flavobacterium sp.]